MKQVFGYTPANPPTGQVGYVAAHVAPDGWAEITVRQHGEEMPHVVSMKLPPDQAYALARALLDNTVKLEPA